MPDEEIVASTASPDTDTVDTSSPPFPIVTTTITDETVETNQKTIVIYSVDTRNGLSLDEVRNAIVEGAKTGNIVVPVGVTVNTVVSEATHIVQDAARILRIKPVSV